MMRHDCTFTQISDDNIYYAFIADTTYTRIRINMIRQLVESTKCLALGVSEYKWVEHDKILNIYIYIMRRQNPQKDSHDPLC